MTYTKSSVLSKLNVMFWNSDSRPACTAGPNCTTEVSQLVFKVMLDMTEHVSQMAGVRSYLPFDQSMSMICQLV